MARCKFWSASCDGSSLIKWHLQPLQQLYEAFTSSTGLPLSTLPRPHEQFPNLSASLGGTDMAANGDGDEAQAKEAYKPEPFNLPVISLPIDTDEETVPQSAKLPGSARPVTGSANAAAAPGESDDWAREPVGYSGVRAQLAFFLDDVSVF